MELITVAIIATAVYGVVTALSIFIHNLLLSRDKRLNENAQLRALSQETKELEKLRQQQEISPKLDVHYRLMNENKDAIQYIDGQIEGVLAQKLQLVQRYAEVTTSESKSVIQGEYSPEKQHRCEQLREEVSQQIVEYDRELQMLQEQRKTLWKAHSRFQIRLLEQEKKRNEKLNEVYLHHATILEKLFLRNNQGADDLAKHAIDSSTSVFQLLTAPLQLLFQFFNLSSGINPDTVHFERASREDVAALEHDINEGDVDEARDALFEQEEVDSHSMA